ncbi:hypothetical protein E5678_18865 [Hydrogenophaga sp. PAMC20947]|nr:hypothetical protein E5678_18865 [Hydrogenophaga sp. PAMC20947]
MPAFLPMAFLAVAFLAAGFLAAGFTAAFLATGAFAAAFFGAAVLVLTATAFFGAAVLVFAATAFFSAAASFSIAFCRALALRSAPTCRAASRLLVLRLVASSFFSAALTDLSADVPALDSSAWAFASCFSAAFTRPLILCETAVPTSWTAELRCAPAVASSDFLVVLRVAMFFL